MSATKGAKERKKGDAEAHTRDAQAAESEVVGDLGDENDKDCDGIPDDLDEVAHSLVHSSLLHSFTCSFFVPFGSCFGILFLNNLIL